MVTFMSMMGMMRMLFYTIETKDGNIHVQNHVGPYRGQHHVHTKTGFKRWLKTSKISREDITHTRKADICNCGFPLGRVCDLRPGQVMEYDGQVWENPTLQ